MLNLYFLLIFASANYAFNLISWYQIHGTFNIFDVGNALIVAGVMVAIVFRSRQLAALSNPFTILIVIYLISSLLQPAIASMHYNQSLLDGLIAVRHQFYYFSFFLFLLLLDKPQKAEKLLDWLSVVALILVFLSVINYFGPVIFHGDWAEGHGIRAGIKRAFIPAMPIISASLIWQFSKWISASGNTNRSSAASLILLGAHFFRQSRGRLIGAIGLILVLLFYKKRFKILGLIVFLSIIAIGVAQVTMKENIFLSSFMTATEEVKKSEGTWAARQEQMAADIKEFQKNPWIGSGLIALRLQRDTILNLGGNTTDLAFKVAGQDLGYYHWVKFYGVAGIIWLAILYYRLWLGARLAERKLPPENRALALFALSYVGYVAVTYVTLSHFTSPDGILLVCFTTVIIARSVRGNWSRPAQAISPRRR